LRKRGPPGRFSLDVAGNRGKFLMPAVELPRPSRRYSAASDCAVSSAGWSLQSL
jgi:hypothetical protein